MDECDAFHVNVARAQPYGKSLLWYACQGGHLSICQLLAQKGCDIGEADEYGVTPMHVACTNNHVAVCQWLYDMGATGDILEVGVDEVDPITSAGENGCISACKWLLENGVRVDETWKGLMMTTAVNRGDLSMCKWLYTDLKTVPEWRSGASLPVCKWLVEEVGLDIAGAIQGWIIP